MATNRTGFFVGLATGVFLGAVATMAAVHFDVVSPAKESQGVRYTRVLTMKPEQFPQRCGTLVSDKLTPSDFPLTTLFGPTGKPPPLDHRKITVAMTLPGGQEKNVTAVFAQYASDEGGTPEWHLRSVGGYDQMSGPLGGLDMIVELYPCTTKP